MIIDKIRKVNKIEENRIKNEKASDMMIGKWVKCDSCKEIIYKDELHKNLSVCPNCNKHFRLSARRRIKQIADDGTFKEIGEDILTKDPLNFNGYMKKVEGLRAKTKIEEAVKCRNMLNRRRKNSTLRYGWKLLNGKYGNGSW